MALLHHMTEGSGPPVLLLHPIGLDLTSWRPVAERLAEGFTVHAFDQKGHGLSPAVSQGYRLTDYADDTARSLKAFADERVTVLGLGGLAKRQRVACVGNNPSANRDHDTRRVRFDRNGVVRPRNLHRPVSHDLNRSESETGLPHPKTALRQRRTTRDIGTGTRDWNPGRG